MIERRPHLQQPLARPPETSRAQAPPPGSSWTLPAVLVIAACAFVYWRAWVCDDAYITFRHVRNCLAGHGPVFNVGERVQAFTHPLWFMLCLAGGAVFDLHAFVVGAGLVSTAAMVLTMSWFLRQRREAAMERAISHENARVTASVLVLGVAVLLGSPTFVEFQTSGLETAMSSLLLVILGAAVLLRREGPDRTVRPSTLVLVSALIVLNRPDHLPICGPVLIWALLASLRQRGEKWRAAAAMLPAILWYGFAAIYYGTPLPNTAYAKAALPLRLAAPKGLAYLLDYASHEPVQAAVMTASLVGGLVISARAVVRRRAGAGLIACLFAGLWLQAASMIALGGDFMRGRFLLPVLVGSILPGLDLIRAFARDKVLRCLIAGVALLPSVACLVQGGALRIGDLRLGLRLLQDAFYQDVLWVGLWLAVLLGLAMAGAIQLRRFERPRRAARVFVAVLAVEGLLLVASIGHWQPPWAMAVGFAVSMGAGAGLIGMAAAGDRVEANAMGIALLIAVASTALLELRPREALLDTRTGIADEYSWYRGRAAEPRFRAPERFREPRPGDWGAYGVLARGYAERYGPFTVAWATTGYFSHHAGPSVHIIDVLGLGDAFVARCPPDLESRVGHIHRRIPRGYLESRGTVNLLEDWQRRLRESDGTLAGEARRMKREASWDDPAARRRWERTKLVISGPLFSRERLRAIPAFAAGY